MVRGRGAAVLYLPQLDATDDRAAGTGGAPRAPRRRRRRRAHGRARRRARARPDVVDAHAEALEEWLARGGADVDARLDQAATAGDLDPALLDRPAAALSGGQRARAMLAAIEAARSDVLLLDEPANHLDATGLERLRALLLTRAGGIVLVAHDRELLAAVSNQVVELDPHTGAAASSREAGRRTRPNAGRARRRAEEAHDRAVAERDRLRSRELAMRGRGAGVRRRSAAESDKHIRHAMRQSAQRSADGLASAIARRAERIEIPDAPWESDAPALPFAAGGSRSGVVAALRAAVLTRGAFSLGPLDLEVRDGDRVLLAGPNGMREEHGDRGAGGPSGAVRRGLAHRVAGAVAEVGQERGSLLAQRQPRPGERGAGPRGPRGTPGAGSARVDGTRQGPRRTAARDALAG